MERVVEIAGRLDTGLGDHVLPGGAEDTNRFGAPPRPAESSDQLSAETFTQREFGGECPELTDDPVVTAKRDVEVDELLDHRETVLFGLLGHGP